MPLSETRQRRDHLRRRTPFRAVVDVGALCALTTAGLCTFPAGADPLRGVAGSDNSAVWAPAVDTRAPGPATPAGADSSGAQAVSIESATYVVVPGDTLWRIAIIHGVSGGWSRLYEVNRAVVGVNPNTIHPGQTLLLPDAATALGPRGRPVPGPEDLSPIAAAIGRASGDAAVPVSAEDPPRGAVGKWLFAGLADSPERYQGALRPRPQR